jgi:2-polyprenyl-3-methyl-5-hydroxy-6-metoxy-1,4-benzoquinol methylase
VKHGRILSLGCGEGFDVKRIFEKTGASLEYACGLDLNHSALLFSKTLLHAYRFDVVNGDINHLPLKINSFDLLLCLEVLEHLECPSQPLGDISHSFGGHCIFSVPNEPLYRLTRMMLLRKNIRQWGNHPEHVNHWSKAEFVECLSDYFTVDRVVTVFPWTVVLCHANTD